MEDEGKGGSSTEGKLTGGIVRRTEEGVSRSVDKGKGRLSLRWKRGVQYSLWSVLVIKEPGRLSRTLFLKSFLRLNDHSNSSKKK